jgi:hypothetical protein
MAFEKRKKIVGNFEIIKLRFKKGFLSKHGKERYTLTEILGVVVIPLYPLLTTLMLCVDLGFAT